LQQIQNLKNIISIFFSLLILCQSFSKVWIIISFKINQDYIAKVLCVNRDKPEVSCNGKCALMKDLKADEGQDKKQLPKKSKEQKEITYCFEILPWLIVEPIENVVSKKHPTFYLYPRSISHLMRVFHPPNAGGASLRFA